MVCVMRASRSRGAWSSVASAGSGRAPRRGPPPVGRRQGERLTARVRGAQARVLGHRPRDRGDRDGTGRLRRASSRCRRGDDVELRGRQIRRPLREAPRRRCHRRAVPRTPRRAARTSARARAELPQPPRVTRTPTAPPACCGSPSGRPGEVEGRGFRLRQALLRHAPGLVARLPLTCMLIMSGGARCATDSGRASAWRAARLRPQAKAPALWIRSHGRHPPRATADDSVPPGGRLRVRCPDCGRCRAHQGMSSASSRMCRTCGPGGGGAVHRGAGRESMPDVYGHKNPTWVIRGKSLDVDRYGI